MTKRKPATEYDLVTALRPLYPAGEFALLRQVGNTVGFSGARRTADAIALGTWPSRGIHLHGFEAKSYRGDWKREHAKPEKAEAIASFCNYWWIVAAHENVVDADELPKPWGLYVLEDGVLVKKKPAEFRADAKPMTMKFMAAILRQADTQLDPEKIRKEITGEERRKWREKFEEEAKSQQNYTLETAVNESKRLKKIIDVFQKASGVNLEQFSYQDPEKLGRVFQEVLYGTHERAREDLKKAAKAVLVALETET